MRQRSTAVAMGGRILVLSVLFSCFRAYPAGSAAGAAAGGRRNSPARGLSSNPNCNRCSRAEQAARSLSALRGGAGGKTGGRSSDAVRGVLEEGTEGGDGSRDPNDDVDADAAGEDPDIDLVPDGMIGDEKEEEEDPERDGGKREEEAAIKAVEEVEVVEEVEQEANWLDRDASEVLPKTAPAFQLVLRGCFLLLVFLFPILTSGLAYLSSWFREKVWYGALTHSIGLCGTAFIKWGQWSSTRPDMFPEGLCEKLSVLHKGAPSHKYKYTKILVERAYGGRSISEVFDWFDSKPMASGSIAQVHKAVLHGDMVAVKVRHPKVKERMFLDFALMKKVAAFADRQPKLKWMNLGPSMEQFSNTMSAQTDLVLEAKHLDAFNSNFKSSAWSDCVFPRVIFCVEDVLVETFEEGIVVAEYAKLFSRPPGVRSRESRPREWIRRLQGTRGMQWIHTKIFGKRWQHPQDKPPRELPDTVLGHFIVTRGEDMWLKMVLNDGLLHADLHPGNILVHAPKDGVSPPRLVLVDAGMVAKLFGHQRRHFIRLLECLGSGDGIAAGQTVLQFSTKQTCVAEEDQAAFLADMETVFKETCNGYHTDVDVGDILRGVLTCVRQHSVRVDVEYATLILNILCLDGMGKIFLPTYNLLDGAQTLLEAHKVGRRLLGGWGVKAVLPVARAFKWRQDRKFLRRLKRAAASMRKKKAKRKAAILKEMKRQNKRQSKNGTHQPLEVVTRGDNPPGREGVDTGVGGHAVGAGAGAAAAGGAAYAIAAGDSPPPPPPPTPRLPNGDSSGTTADIESLAGAGGSGDGEGLRRIGAAAVSADGGEAPSDVAPAGAGGRDDFSTGESTATAASSSPKPLRVEQVLADGSVPEMPQDTGLEPE